jgi:hypothetical protein
VQQLVATHLLPGQNAALFSDSQILAKNNSGLPFYVQHSVESFRLKEVFPATLASDKDSIYGRLEEEKNWFNKALKEGVPTADKVAPLMGAFTRLNPDENKPFGINFSLPSLPKLPSNLEMGNEPGLNPFSLVLDQHNVKHAEQKREGISWISTEADRKEEGKKRKAVDHKA